MRSTLLYTILALAQIGCGAASRTAPESSGRWESPDSPAHTPKANLVVVGSRAHVDTRMSLLEVIRSRLALAVEHGRFRSEDGVLNTCVFRRRSSFDRKPARAPNELPWCPIISLFVDGISTADAAAYLTHARATDFESIEILSAHEAMQRFGFSSRGSDALVLWTRGRGPHAGR